MVMLVKVFGMVILAFGVYYLLNPNIIKPYVAFWKKGKRLYMGGALSLLIGIIFLLAARQCEVTWFVALLGIMALIKAIALFIMRREKVMAMMNWWVERPVTFLRVHALFAIAFGALLILSA